MEAACFYGYIYTAGHMTATYDDGYTPPLTAGEYLYADHKEYYFNLKSGEMRLSVGQFIDVGDYIVEPYNVSVPRESLIIEYKNNKWHIKPLPVTIDLNAP